MQDNRCHILLLERVGIRKKERFPFMQINNAELVAVIDRFIRTSFLTSRLIHLKITGGYCC